MILNDYINSLYIMTDEYKRTIALNTSQIIPTLIKVSEYDDLYINYGIHTIMYRDFNNFDVYANLTLLSHKNLDLIFKGKVIIDSYGRVSKRKILYLYQYGLYFNINVEGYKFRLERIGYYYFDTIQMLKSWFNNNVGFGLYSISLNLDTISYKKVFNLFNYLVLNRSKYEKMVIRFINIEGKEKSLDDFLIGFERYAKYTGILCVIRIPRYVVSHCKSMLYSNIFMFSIV